MIPFLMIQTSTYIHPYVHMYVHRKRSGRKHAYYYQCLPLEGGGRTDERKALTLYFLLFGFFQGAVHPFCTIFVILILVKINKRKWEPKVRHSFLVGGGELWYSTSLCNKRTLKTETDVPHSSVEKEAKIELL